MDAEEAITILRNTAWLGSEKELCAVEEAIRMAVEALGVVRCKDCFHFAPGTEKFDAFRVHNSVPVDEDGMGFCSEGVKKTEILDDPMEGESRQ